MPSLKLVIVADDFGIGEERDDGIVDCFKKGAITRSTLLVNGVSAKSAVKKAAQVSLPLGLHLNLTEGNTISKPDHVPTLINASTGYMHGSSGFRNVVRDNLVHMKQVEIEIRSQIERFRELTGELPKHVDGHQHAHLIPGIADVFAAVLSDYNIPWTRLSLDRDIDVETANAKFASIESMELVNVQSLNAKPLLERKNVKFTDKFTGSATMGHGLSVPNLKKVIQKHIDSNENNSRIQSLELMVHPGFPCTSGHGGCGDGPDEFTISDDRKHEMDVLCNEELLKFYVENDIELCAYP